MSASRLSGPPLSFTTGGREMDENDCDCEVDGSFIIIPKHNNDSTSVGSPPNPAPITAPAVGMDRSVNVFQVTKA